MYRIEKFGAYSPENNKYLDARNGIIKFSELEYEGELLKSQIFKYFKSYPFIEVKLNSKIISMKLPKGSSYLNFITDKDQVIALDLDESLKLEDRYEVLELKDVDFNSSIFIPVEATDRTLEKLSLLI